MTNWILKLSQSQKKITLLLRKYKITPEQLNLNIQSDPTPNKQYLDWILRQTTSNPPRLRLPEDQEKTINTLKMFHNKKQFLNKRDINQYSSLGELTQSLEAVTGQTSKREEVRINTQEGQQLIAQDGVYKCLKITKEEAAASLCRNTEWCIKDPKYFREYHISESNPLFLFLKNNVPFALLNIESAQFKNVYDNDLTDTEKKELFYILNISLSNKEFYKHIEHSEQGESKSSYFFCKAFGRRIKQLEPFVIKNPESAYFYARDVIKGRWKEAEPAIMKDVGHAYFYARNVIQGRWLEAEPYIMKNPEYAYLYAVDIIKGRWPEAEPYIMQDVQQSYFYAKFVIKGRWPEAEPVLLKDHYWGDGYRYYITSQKEQK